MQQRSVVAIWLLAIGVSLLLAWLTAVGPVILVLQRDHHGIHVGDLAGVGVCTSWALLLTHLARRRDG